ncbi:MAG: prolyl oligopeptidase family serine peptidase [Saprospiraceae bacterium]
MRVHHPAIGATRKKTLCTESPSDTFPNGMITLPQGWDMVEEDLLKMLDMVQGRYQGDRQRTYLTGLSYGGFGTWHLASTHPEKFAAIAPVVGWGHPSRR